MFLIGLIAIAQMTLLPGALLLRCFPARDRDLLERIILIFALSLTANAVLVPALVLVHAYVAPVLWCVLAAETGALLWLNLRQGGAGAARMRVRLPGAAFRTGGLAASLAVILALATVLVFLRICYQNWNTVFDSIDDVMNYDRWACEWAENHFPLITWHYPQLLPANWSLSYVLTGNSDIKIFAKAIMPLFPLCTVLLFVSLAARRKRLSHLFGLVLAGWALIHYLGVSFMTSGYTDIPLAFFCFVTFYPVYAWTLERGQTAAAGEAAAPSPPGVNETWLVLLLASGTMLTKQGGIFALCAALAWLAVVGMRRGWKTLTAAPRPAIAAGATVLLTVIAWYLYKEYQIHARLDVSNLSVLMTDLHAGRSYWQRLAAAGGLIWHMHGVAGPWVAGTLGLLYLGGFALRATRPIVLWLATPFLICWGLWFSYEIRTLAPLLPFVGLVAGLVLGRLVTAVPGWLPPALSNPVAAAFVVIGVTVAMVCFFTDPWALAATLMYARWLCLAAAVVLAGWVVHWKEGALEVWWPGAAAGALVLALALTATTYQTGRLVAEQGAAARRNGFPDLNQQLYAIGLDRQHGGIVSDYWFLRSLPGIRPAYRRLVCWSAPCSFADLRGVRKFYPDAAFILINEHSLTDAARESLASATDLRTIFVIQGFRMIELEKAQSAERLGDNR